MSELKKATLQEISSDVHATPLGPEVSVQFNPTTLRLQISNNLPGGASRGNQVRQYTGSSSTTLTLDLVFDTADEGTTAAPRSVREKTAIVEKFVLPKGQTQDKQAPPKLRFQWGNLLLDGIVDSVSLDFDLFAADGTPLRAKVNLTIKEQNSKYQFLSAGPGANREGSKPQPGQASLGTQGNLGIAAQASLAIGGESAAEFAARVGVDPAAWRGLAADLSNPLSLEAGVEVGFHADLNVNAGLGVTLGVEVGVAASLEASVGLEASTSLTAVAGVGVGAELASGFALSAAGGVSAAVAAVQIAKTQAASQQARHAFGLPTSDSVSPSGPAQVAANRVTAAAKPGAVSAGLPPSAKTQLPSPVVQQATLSTSPSVDPRAGSFGFGVPLRSSVGQAADLRAGALQGRVPLRAQIGENGAPPTVLDPTLPPWVSLPAQDQARRVADMKQHRLRPPHPCGCVGRCRHRKRQ